ncbi:hypothetical protein VP1G_11362 [Cytospora mali]|uniref:Uncharacterized protein n=1 Tax=Cytospora mali TaxID=578113 RepID=A0A194VDB3_CYTMA|nr:hypothetical protein VP1G_11362 [Valsa mali var. pyri (nom. inval.)]
MTQVRSFGMTDTREAFVEGAKVFRNARDLAQDHRDAFIQTANAKARGEASATSDILTSTAAVQNTALSPNKLVDLEESPESRDVHDGMFSPLFRQDPDDDLATPHNGNTVLPSCLHEDDQHDKSLDSLSVDATEREASVVTSLTSSITSGNDTESHRARSKRNRNSNSPRRVLKRNHII